MPEGLRAERGSIWAVLGNTFVGHEVDGIATRFDYERNQFVEFIPGDGTMPKNQDVAVLVVSDRLGIVMADFKRPLFEFRQRRGQGLRDFMGFVCTEFPLVDDEIDIEFGDFVGRQTPGYGLVTVEDREPVTAGTGFYAQFAGQFVTERADALDGHK